MKCKNCDNELKGKQTKFCSKACNRQSTNFKHQNYECQQKRGFLRKIMLVNMLGGKCSECGYDKNLSAIDFHHLRDKTSQLDIRNLSNSSLEWCLAEAKKCVLLCSNCHREQHNPNGFNWK